MGRRPRTQRPRTGAGAEQGSQEWASILDKKLMPAPETDPWALPSLMAETNGGGSVESVPGFDIFRAVTSGFETRRLAGPTRLMARPDGGYFSESFDEVQPATRRASARKPENVLGVDSRVMVENTSTIPWRCICHLEVEYQAGPVGYGTGFMIGPKTVVTAAHVLVDPAKNRQARRIRVIPGRNGSTAPYGFFVIEFAKCQVPDEWLATGSANDAAAAFDYAAIPIPDEEKVENQNLADRLGYFGLKCFADGASVKKAEMLFVNNAGYPSEADKPYGTLWYNAGRIRKIEDKVIEYMVDTEGGQSGSPIYFFDEQAGQRYVVAIHTTGDFVNRGLRITKEVFNKLKEWSGR